MDQVKRIKYKSDPYSVYAERITPMVVILKQREMLIDKIEGLQDIIDSMKKRNGDQRLINKFVYAKRDVKELLNFLDSDLKLLEQEGYLFKNNGGKNGKS